jgi:hypothetical protein
VSLSKLFKQRQSIFRKDLDMQDNSTSQTLDVTRGGGPDDSRELKTPDKAEDEEQEVNTNESDVWR